MALMNFTPDPLLDETMEKTIAAFVKASEKERRDKTRQEKDEKE